MTKGLRHSWCDNLGIIKIIDPFEKMSPNGRVEIAAIGQVSYQSIVMLLGIFGRNGKLKGLFWAHNWTNHTKFTGKMNEPVGS